MRTRSTKSPWTSRKKTSMTTPTSMRTRTPVPSTKKTWTKPNRRTTTIDPPDRGGVRRDRPPVRGPRDRGRAVQRQMMGSPLRLRAGRHARQRSRHQYGEDGETDGENKEWIDASVES